MDSSEYKVLARKYRPQNFEDLIGQETLVRTLRNAIESNRIAHAFLLTGIRGVGKTTTARIMAKALNCTKEDNPVTSPCGECQNCTSILKDNNPDVIEMDAASRTGVSDIRDIIENVMYKPTQSRFKIYIIDEVHMLSNNAFNALLKTLEEPPKFVKFIFATTEIRKIPITIISRCQRFDLRRVESEELKNHLKKITELENSNAEDEALLNITKASEGSVRDSLSILDQAIAHSGSNVTMDVVSKMLGLVDENKITNLFNLISNGKTKESLELLNELYIGGSEPEVIIGDLLKLTHKITKSKIIENPKYAEFVDIELSILNRTWQLLTKGLNEVKFSNDPLIAAEMIIIRLNYISSMPTIENIVKGLDEEKKNSNELDSKEVTVKQEVNSNNIIQESPNISEISKNIENKVNISSFEEMIDFFKEKKELIIYNSLVSDVNLVSFTIGRVELRVNEYVDQKIINEMTQILNDNMSTSWQVIISQKEGDLTIAEQAELKYKELEDNVRKEKNITDILEQFPDAKILKIEEF